MRHIIRDKLLEMADTLTEAVEYIAIAPPDEAEQMRGDCIMMLEAMGEVLGDEPAALECCKRLAALIKGGETIAQAAGELRASIEAIQGRRKALFLPYYANTWDSLKSVYEAFAADPAFETEIVIIPIMRNTPTGTKRVYEDYLTPVGVPNTHYDRYSFEDDLPDIVFYNNPYDGVNIPKFYSHEVKKYAGLMVYVPYYLYTYGEELDKLNAGALNGELRKAWEEKRVQKYGLSGHDNADIFVVQSEAIKAQAGLHPNKRRMVALGNPKTDEIYRAKAEGRWPRHEAWERVLEGKTAFMLNTHYTWAALTRDQMDSIAFYTIFFNAIFDFIKNNNNAALIWRPHPQTFLMLGNGSPGDELFRSLFAEAEALPGVIVDRTDEAISAMMYSSALFTGFSSIMNQYLVMDKPVFLGSYVTEMCRGEALKTEEGQLPFIVRRDTPERPYYIHAVEGVGLREVCREALNPSLTDEERIAVAQHQEIYVPIQSFMRDIMRGEDVIPGARRMFVDTVFANNDGTCADGILEHMKRTRPVR